MAEGFIELLDIPREFVPKITDELHPALQEYVTSSPFGRSLKHPLVIDPIISPDPWWIGQANLRYFVKKRELDAAYAAQNWGKYIALVERPYRVQYFSWIASAIPAARYWKQLAWIWIDSENIWQNKKEWNNLLRGGVDRKNLALRPLMMSKAERAKLQSFPDQLTIYRGCRAHNRRGISWTLDAEKAQWFATRLAQPSRDICRLVTATCAKKDVIAYFDARNESEILVSPAHVTIVREERVYRD